MDNRLTVTKGDWTPEAMDDLKERLRADAEWCAERVAVTPRQIGRDCEEALTYIKALEQHVSELKEALSDVRRRLEYGLQNAGLDCLESALRIDAVLNREPNP
jgi:hypothetical protein